MIKHLVVLLFCVFCAFSACYFALNTANNILLSVIEANNNTIKTFENHNDKIKNDFSNYFSLVPQINIIQKEYVPWTKMFVMLNDIQPSEISLTEFRINYDQSTQNYLLYLKGQSASRDSLKTYKENLENLDFLKNLDFPLSNLTSKENNFFEIKAEIEQNQLKTVAYEK